LTLVMGDTVTRNISLNRPLLNLGATSINVTTNNHVPIEVVLPLSNAGDGPLHVTVAVRGNSYNDPWLTLNRRRPIFARRRRGLRCASHRTR
jgi:hypothetical protein